MGCRRKIQKQRGLLLAAPARWLMSLSGTLLDPPCSCPTDKHTEAGFPTCCAPAVGGGGWLPGVGAPGAGSAGSQDGAAPERLTSRLEPQPEVPAGFTGNLVALGHLALGDHGGSSRGAAAPGPGQAVPPEKRSLQPALSQGMPVSERDSPLMGKPESAGS